MKSAPPTFLTYVRLLLTNSSKLINLQACKYVYEHNEVEKWDLGVDSIEPKFEKGMKDNHGISHPLHTSNQILQVEDFFLFKQGSTRIHMFPSWNQTSTWLCQVKTWCHMETAKVFQPFCNKFKQLHLRQHILMG